MKSRYDFKTISISVNALISGYIRKFMYPQSRVSRLSLVDWEKLSLLYESRPVRLSLQAKLNSATSARTSTSLRLPRRAAQPPPRPARTQTVTVSVQLGRGHQMLTQTYPLTPPLTMSLSWSSGSETTMRPQPSTLVSVRYYQLCMGRPLRSTSRRG